MSPHISAAGPDASGTRAMPSPGMLDVFDLAARLKVSTRHLRRLIDAGKCPQPVRLGRSCRWPAVTVEQWILDGCPNCRKRPGVAR
jgi:predicted DNA-binding transcriptional regulator AlpA